MSRLNAEINVTPLVDVCLVLLIIFMIVLPSLVNGVPVQLPETEKAQDLEERIFPVTIKADGTVYLEELVIRADEVPNALRGLYARESARPIAIRADKRVAYGDVVDVMAACREAGWQSVTLVSSLQAPAVDATPR